MSTPRCPACGWHLEFVEHEGRWLGRCPNYGKLPPQVPCVRAGREVRPVSARQQEVLDTIAVHGPRITTDDLASSLGLALNTASMRLAAMEREGVLRRVRIDPKRGGKRFAYESTARR